MAQESLRQQPLGRQPGAEGVSGRGREGNRPDSMQGWLCVSVFMPTCVSVYRYVDVIEQAVVTGEPVLIENLEETIDPIIDPLLGRHTIKKGR